MTVQLWKIVIWYHSDHPDHQIWTPYMLCMSLDQCSPVFSVRDKHFQKVTNWSALVPDINSEQRDLWPFWLMPVALIQWNEWLKICVYVVKGPQIVKKWHQIDDSSLLQKCQLCKIVIWYHSDHQIWTPYMWSMSLDRCSPVFSVRDKNFQKVTNWSTLVPEINSEQRDLWPFWLLPVALIQWKEWPKICVYVVKEPQIVKKWHQIDDSSLLQKCQFCMLAMYKGQYHAEND